MDDRIEAERAHVRVVVLVVVGDGQAVGVEDAVGVVVVAADVGVVDRDARVPEGLVVVDGGGGGEDVVDGADEGGGGGEEKEGGEEEAAADEGGEEAERARWKDAHEWGGYNKGWGPGPGLLA